MTEQAESKPKTSGKSAQEAGLEAAVADVGSDADLESSPDAVPKTEAESGAGSKSKPKASLAEMREIIYALPGPSAAAREAVRHRESQLTKPPGALGRLEQVTEWFAAWQGQEKPRLERTRVAVFAGNHGVVVRGVSAYPAAVTAQMVANFRNGGAAVNQLCEVYGAELCVYEMALDSPTANFTQGPAMTDEQCATAMAYGMMTVEEGLDCLCLGEMGIGNSTSAAALAYALFGGTARDWVGPGTGVQGAALDNKIQVVEEAVALHRAAMTDPLEILRHLGGFELAAIVGAVIAARVAKVPVILDGYACAAAAAILHKMDGRTLHHCLIGHLSAEPGHARLLEAIQRAPVFRLDMRLGEATGAVMALGVVKSAIACHTGMATFGEAGVSGAV